MPSALGLSISQPAGEAGEQMAALTGPPFPVEYRASGLLLHITS